MCKESDSHSASLNKAVIKVIGMTCSHCKQSVETAVLGLPGVISALVDLQEGTLTVDFDHRKTTLNQLKAEVESVGFDVV